jgi:hypothetical protein
MRVSRTALPVFLFLLVMPAMASTSFAAAGCPEGVGRLSSDALSAGVCVPGGQSPDVTPVATGGRSGSSNGGSTSGGAPSPYQWQRTYPDEYPSALRTTGNPLRTQTGPTPVCAGAGGVEGRPYTDTLTDTRTGDIISSSSGCEVPGQAAGASGRPTPPPPPPTAQEVWTQVPLPEPVLAMSPEGNGLTGLATWLWSSDPGPLTAQTSIRGYTATARATPVRWVWTMWKPGDTPNLNPDPRVESTAPGSAANPAATYTYETRGDYTVTLTVWWSGDFTFSGYGVSQRQSLGDTSRSASRSYHVIEVRSVRVSGGEPLHVRS